MQNTGILLMSHLNLQLMSILVDGGAEAWFYRIRLLFSTCCYLMPKINAVVSARLKRALNA